MAYRSSVPFVEWDEFRKRLRWRQGDHLTAVGPTKSGKTTFVREILSARKYVAVLVTKNVDPSLDRFKRQGYREVKDWTPTPQIHPRLLIKPGLRNAREKHKQRAVFQRVLDDVFRSGGWTVYADELRYLSENLRLKEELELLWLQARSNNATLVTSTQRPFHIPLEAYSQAVHLAFWADNDDRNLARIGGLNGVDSLLVRREVANLGQHELLYVKTEPPRVLLRTVVKQNR